MLDNFSDAAIKIVQLAFQETRKLNHEVIGTEHLLLGLLSDETCKPAIVLKSLGITRTKAKQEVLRIMTAGTKEVNDLEYTFTPRAKAVFKLADKNREHNIDDLVEPEDIMMALLTVPRCTAQKVLHALDIEVATLLTRISNYGSQYTESNLASVTLDQLEGLHERIRSGELPASSDECPEPDPAAGRDPMIGYIIDRKYEVVSAIGCGGMGVVYKVRHLILGRYFAIKVIHPYLAADVRNRRRFQREAQAASRLTHQNLATVFDWDIMEDGRPYLVMYYIEGVKLSELIKVRATVEVLTWLSIFLQMCDALTHAHENGVLHRDLKPGNVILSTSDDTKHFVKIVDFGIAKILSQSPTDAKELTKTGEVFGSPYYMSPEQCMGQTLDVRSDIYQLGVVMYECFTGLCPFYGGSLYDTMTMHVKNRPPSFKETDHFNNSAPDLEAIVMRCLSKLPEQRYQSMRSLRRALILTLGTSHPPSHVNQLT
ncbi:MAG: protein kinase [Candidatus Melainabacteria bacterium]|nr:protein kinase [Candidatus Melainabacteria bacterium]